MLFKQVTIIGFGLIGSSLARAIREQGLAEKIICADSSRAVCDRVLVLGLADQVTTDLAKGVKGSDLVVLATPVGVMGLVCEKISPHLEDGAIITDTGSVKSKVMDLFSTFLPARVHAIGGHPIAGTEHSGPDSGFSALFINRWCVLTPYPKTELWVIEKLVRLWEACGCVTEIMEPDHHDLVLAITSHLPHLIAYTIVGTATDLESDIKSEVIKFSASGFRDFTRIASSDPVMWRDIFLNNKTAALEILQRFTEDLTAMQKAIRKGDGDYLYQRFSKTREIRRAVIEAGQAAYVYPTQTGESVPPVWGQDSKSDS